MSDTGIKETEIEAQYPDRFWGKMGKVKWDVQFTKEGAEGKGETFKVAENGQTTEVKSVARVWMTQMDNQEGKGNAVCYLLGEVKGTDKPEPKDTRNQTRTITFTQVVVS